LDVILFHAIFLLNIFYFKFLHVWSLVECDSGQNAYVMMN